MFYGQRLTLQRLLEVKDLCDVATPDERSVMTYVAEFFHKFSSEGEFCSTSRYMRNIANCRQDGNWSSSDREVCRTHTRIVVSRARRSHPSTTIDIQDEQE